MVIEGLAAARRLREGCHGHALTKEVQTNYAFLERTMLVPISGPVALVLEDPGKQ